MLAHWHIAKADHRLTVFASVEYPVSDPPDHITIDGVTFVRKALAEAARPADAPTLQPVLKLGC